jgi:aryl-alcohol dehydrogenase
MALKIKAAVIEAEDQPFMLEDVDLDEPRADEVLVRIVAAGICQTDAHVVHQTLPTPLPAVLGHEGAGIVERVGPAVTSVKPGDHVVLSYQACGHCAQCLAGHYAYCDQAMEANFSGARLDGTVGLHRRPGAQEPGELNAHFFGQSSFATYALTTERNTAKVPDDAPLELLAPLGCGLQTGAGAVLNSLRVEPGSAFAVFGTGAVGLAAVMAAAIAGAAVIIGVDINDERLELAKELGATHTINPLRDDAVAEIRRITSSGVNYLLDTTGRNDMLQQAVASMASRGQIGLVASAGTETTVPAAALAMGISVRGIVQGDAIAQTFIPELVRQYQAGRFPFDKLVRFYPFEDINEAFDAAGRGDVIKPVLRVAQP